MAATICLPKHFICSTFVPDFTPGPENSVLQTFDEKRGRLETGNSFFRSIDVGTIQNSISVKSEWLENIGGSIFVPTLEASNTVRVRLTVTDGSALETFLANQLFGVSTWSLDGRAALASQIDASSLLIEMGKTDTQQPWPLASTAMFQGTFITTNLSGAEGGPITIPTSSIRTGPIHAFILINFSEINSSVGTMAEINEMREWRNVVGGSPLEFDWACRLDPVQGSTCFDPETVASNFCDTGL